MGFTSHMDLALDQARKAAARGEVPVGAVIVSPQGAVIAQAGNRVMEDRDPSAHAEVLAIRQACAALGSERLTGCALYVTLEPCEQAQSHHKPEVYDGICEEEASEMLRDFFAARRKG